MLSLFLLLLLLLLTYLKAVVENIQKYITFVDSTGIKSNKKKTTKKKDNFRIPKTYHTQSHFPLEHYTTPVRQSSKRRDETNQITLCIR